jgi:hypothetical protein
MIYGIKGTEEMITVGMSSVTVKKLSIINLRGVPKFNGKGRFRSVQ